MTTSHENQELIIPGTEVIPDRKWSPDRKWLPSQKCKICGLTNLDSGLKVHMTHVLSQSDRTVSVLKYQLTSVPKW